MGRARASGVNRLISGGGTATQSRLAQVVRRVLAASSALRTKFALSCLELSLHRLGERDCPRQRPDHHAEVVDQSMLVGVQEVAPVELAVTYARVEDEGMV